METTVTIDYLNYLIYIELPDYKEDNTIGVKIERKEGTYDPESYGSCLKYCRFSGKSQDYNKWVLEAFDVALMHIDDAGFCGLYAPLPENTYRYELACESWQHKFSSSQIEQEAEESDIYF